ncbi:ribosomal protection-like ABC-F family protein [Youxingia wuxianensis]|uniref:ABC-F type ribosomal protection protein n=1 Tax=Youxingia wuxianensis TaxID=2763678 RepID=A0A926ERI4_9FIRM|nr:ABC-F type ribosomal protection protein [Youxingia wuxianensis]MBC8586112.1 ABC-F type ribosomal protection protein [Youxingia wuxianensis]
MALIDVANLSFCYDKSYDNIFENVSFQLDTDWKLGFIGRNGRGKTTFLHLLLGKWEYQGKISAPTLFDYFPYPVPDVSLPVIEILEEIADFQLWELIRELNLLNVDEEVLYRPYFTLSQGEQTKVLLAALFLNPGHFLLIDEPTNHLDMQAREVVANYLKGKKGFILVSHDRWFLDQCIDHVLSINKTNIEVQKGNFSTWEQNKAFQDHFELAENQRLKKDIRRLEESAKRTSRWSDQVEKTKIGSRNSGLRPDRGFIGHKAAKMMKRSKAAQLRKEKAAEEKQQLLHNIDSADSLAINPLIHHAKRLVDISDLAVTYGEYPVCQGVSFCINPGDRIALCGKNGSGKSSILKLLCKDNISYTGVVTLASGLVVSTVSQDTSFLSGDLSAFAKENRLDESLFKAILRKLDFPRIQFEKKMEDFSGGQKKKVLIAKSLCQQAHLYLWDEPLNFIDVLSRIQIEDLILRHRPTMLFVEHDRTFVDKVATKKIQLE